MTLNSLTPAELEEARDLLRSPAPIDRVLAMLDHATRRIEPGELDTPHRRNLTRDIADRLNAAATDGALLHPRGGAAG